MTPNLSEIILGSAAPESREQFHIDTTEKAVWATEKYPEAEKRIEAIQRQMDEYKARTGQWFSDPVQENADTIRFIKKAVRPCAESQIARQKRSKTFKHPGVHIILHKSPGRVEYSDEQLMLSYIKNMHPGLIHIKKSASKTDLKKRIKLNEPVPSVNLVSSVVSLTIKKN